MDNLFSFAWINALLRRLPPGIAQEIEAITREKGFSRVLTALLASSEAQKHLHAGLRCALALERGQPGAVDECSRKLLESLTIDFRRVGH